MEIIKEYLRSQIRPNKNEWHESVQFDKNVFDELIQDGFYFSKEKPVDCANIESVCIGNEYISKKAYTDVAWLVNGAIAFDNTSKPIYRRLLPPPAEILDHVLIMKAIASTMTNITYIEYGVSTGHSLFGMSSLVDRIHAVDVENRLSKPLPNNATFYKMTTDEFSEKRLANIEFSLAFIDADHSFSSAYKDFQNVIKYIKPGGYVILHDTYPCSDEFLAPWLCNDCYKTPIQIKKDYPELSIITIPLQPGLTIVRKN